MAARLAWIGLGNMGRGMVKNIVAKGSLGGHPIILHNRTRARADAFASSLPAGTATVAPSIADAVRDADIVFMCLGDDAAVRATVDEALAAVDGTTAAAERSERRLFVDCSTIHPDTTRGVAERVEAKGIDFVACPAYKLLVFGPPALADAGRLIAVPAGPASAVRRVQAYTTPVTARMDIPFPDRPAQTATLLKIVGNSVLISVIASLAEAHVFAEKSGIGTAAVHELVSALFPGGAYEAYSARMIGGDYWRREEPLFAADLALKDARHILDVAGACGAKLGDIEVAEKLLTGVKEHDGKGGGGKTGDIAGMYGALRKECGLDFAIGLKEEDGKR